MQVSHSKKWPMVPMTDEQGQPVLKKNGKPRLVSSYSLLQTQFFEHMRQAGFTDFERGVQGSDVEHLNVLEYKVQKDRQTVAELFDQTKHLQGQRKELISQVKNISGSIRDVADIEQRAKTKGVLEKRVELPVQDFQTLCEMAKASGKLQAENRSLQMQLQQSTMREQEVRQRLHRCEEQLDAVLNETRPYREAMRVAPEQVQAFVLGICRRQQEEKRLNRQQRRQRAKGRIDDRTHHKAAGGSPAERSRYGRSAGEKNSTGSGVRQAPGGRCAPAGAGTVCPVPAAKDPAFYQSEEGQRLFDEWKNRKNAEEKMRKSKES